MLVWGEQVIAELIGSLLLSDIRKCDLKIISFEWNDPDLSATTADAVIEVEEIGIGNLRNITTFKMPGIYIYPNPASSKVEIKHKC